MLPTTKQPTRRGVLRTIAAGAVAGGLATGVASGLHQTWTAELSPMVEGSRGRGSFELKRVGNRMAFGLEAANLTSAVKMAHIHHTADGAPVVWLYSDVGFHPGDATEHSIQRGKAFVAGGSFMASDLVGHLSGGTLTDLIEAIEAGNTFVRIHTADNLAGEIQGDLG